MGALFGFVIGYILGTRAGREGLDELRQSWKTISQSPEFKGLTETGLSMLGAARGGMRGRT